VNPNGGAIALGHPVGATGAIITVKAMYELERIGGRVRADHHVHRRRPGHRAGHRADLKEAVGRLTRSSTAGSHSPAGVEDAGTAPTRAVKWAGHDTQRDRRTLG
jgi:hypothetical protein